MSSRMVFGGKNALYFKDTDEDLYQLYITQMAALESSIYRALRKRHGIYASNQGKYIRPNGKLNALDSKTMETRNEAFEAFLSHSIGEE